MRSQSVFDWPYRSLSPFLSMSVVMLLSFFHMYTPLLLFLSARSVSSRCHFILNTMFNVLLRGCHFLPSCLCCFCFTFFVMFMNIQRVVARVKPWFTSASCFMSQPYISQYLQTRCILFYVRRICFKCFAYCFWLPKPSFNATNYIAYLLWQFNMQIGWRGLYFEFVDNFRYFPRNMSTCRVK